MANLTVRSKCLVKLTTHMLFGHTVNLSTHQICTNGGEDPASMFKLKKCHHAADLNHAVNVQQIGPCSKLVPHHHFVPVDCIDQFSAVVS